MYGVAAVGDSSLLGLRNGNLPSLKTTEKPSPMGINRKQTHMDCFHKTFLKTVPEKKRRKRKASQIEMRNLDLGMQLY